MIDIHETANGHVWTTDEYEAITTGHLDADAECWTHTTSDGEWTVWRGSINDSHERLYRSPSGQYYLGHVSDTGWAGMGHDPLYLHVAPWEAEAVWLINPIQACVPSMLNVAALRVSPTLDSYPHAREIARRQPFAFMRVVAAAWFLSLEDPWAWDDCPADLQDLVRQLAADARD